MRENRRLPGNPPCKKGDGLEIISWRIILTAARPSALVTEITALEFMSMRHLKKFL